MLEEYRRLPLELHPLISSRLKVLGAMDIAERRAPQDGRFAWTSTQGTEIDVRAASLPTRNGEAITLRLLASKTTDLTLETLGMSAADLETFSAAIQKPHGMILLTGPTGSGKSTTLYAGIRRLIAERALHVVTVEDPIEYEIDGVAQVAVDAADKVSFAKALRSILRHDPDVIMIGEIRDAETADIAIKAALTGHLVLSTLHTNSAVSAVTRLADMGVAPFLIGATLRLVVAQRLVRRLCSHCRRPQPLTEAEAIGLGDAAAAAQTACAHGGCLYCAGRGQSGRLGLFEMLAFDEELSRATSQGADEAQILKLARQKGFRRLVDDARTKVLQGQTTAVEALTAVTVW
jgi:type II secretory ATPase GspE/PulE/Tfp pilus assembly ATPase PilB-like protein